MAKYEINKVEEVTILIPCRVKVDGAKEATFVDRGKTVKVSGNDKSQLLASGHAKVKEVETAKGK